MDMSEKYLPIKIFEKRKDYDDRSTEGGGDSREPGFVLHGEALRRHAEVLTVDIQDVRSELRREASAPRTLPAILATSLNESAIAKTHRDRVVNALESDGGENVIGVFGDRQILSILSGETVLDNLEGTIQREESAILTSSLAGLELFQPVMDEYESGHADYRVRLLNYNDFDRNNLARILFETFCNSLGIQVMKRVRFTADMFIYRVQLDSLEQYQQFSEFEGLYNKVYKSVREELCQKESDLIKPNLNETFEEFISKQTNLNFEFDIKNSNFTYYGNPSYNNYFEELKKNKSFRIEPKDVFLDFYNNEKLQLENKESVKKQFINLYIQKKREINSYFNSLEFYQEIEDMDLDIKIEIDLDLKNEKENDLKYYFNNKTSEKKKEWEDQIQRAKWKMPVQATGSDRCPNGHKFRSDDVFCTKCKENFYWVDGDTDYVICKGCGTVIKIKEPFYCSRCGVELPDKLKRIPGYKP